jgi:probable F420-dependent oxidoreductase
VPEHRPFRFAVQGSHAPTGQAWRERARTLEDLGYSTLYVPDHLDDQWGPLVALTVAAEATQHLNVGPLVLDNDFRHPVVLAKEAATLDLVAEGRLELGLGAGWMRTDYDTSGIAFDPPAERIERLAESIEIMTALWETGRADFTGRHYTVAGAVGTPTPYRRPHPTLVIGGGGRRILTLAAQVADIVSVIPSLAAGVIGTEMAAEAVVDRYRERIAWVKAASVDRDPELQCWTMLAQVVPNAAEMFEQMAPLFSLTPGQLAEVPVAIVGTVEEICETLQARREALGFSYFVIRENEAEGFAPVVAKLAGT